MSWPSPNAILAHTAAPQSLHHSPSLISTNAAAVMICHHSNMPKMLKVTPVNCFGMIRVVTSGTLATPVCISRIKRQINDK